MNSLGSPPLVHQIIDSIKQNGPMPFDRFMQQALYMPGLGYYSSGQQKFGESGDFITAPELSPVFSHCLAQQCYTVLTQLNDPIILEFGAGSGVMAVDILLTLESLHSLPAAYWIIELSAELQSRQRTLFAERAPHLLSHVHWLTELPQEPFEGVILANEVLDAMPVHKFRWMDRDWQEAYVDYQNEQLVWHWSHASSTLRAALKKLATPFSPGYESEVNLFLPAWIGSLSEILSKGLVLLFDYGFPRLEYYHLERSMGTIMCHKAHHLHDNPLLNVGLQDVTAHVDFTAVAEAADASDFDVAGFTNQAAFLMDCGITQRLENIDDEINRFNTINHVKPLILPSEMGELFKVMALTKAYDDALLGFQTLDLLNRL